MNDAERMEAAIRRRAERTSDIYLGRLLRFHPEYAVTPKNPLSNITLVEPPVQVVPIPSALIAIDRDHPPIDLIIRETASFYEISPKEIISSRREKWVANARQVAYWLARNMTPRSLPEIAAKVGGRDHTTILAGVRKIEARRDFDPRLADELQVLTLRIRERYLNAINSVAA